MSNSSQKVNMSRYTLKNVLSSEWDTTFMQDYSDTEIGKMYSLTKGNLSPFPGVAGACNFKVPHLKIPSHNLHVIYYNFPENGRKSTKVTKSACEKIYEYYNDEEVNYEDSLFIIINDVISESLEKSFDELNIRLQGELETSDLNETIINEMSENDIQLDKKHFRNVYVFDINNFTNNILEHRLVPPHRAIREKKEIESILEKCNCTMNQFPIIMKNDIMSKMLRLVNGDICEIVRKSDKAGTYLFYRICR